MKQTISQLEDARDQIAEAYKHAAKHIKSLNIELSRTYKSYYGIGLSLLKLDAKIRAAKTKKP